MKVPVYDEYPNRIAKMWKDEEKKKAEIAAAADGSKGDVDMKDDGEEDDKKHRDMFGAQGQKFTIRNFFFGGLSDSDEDSDSDDEEESEDEGRDMEFDVMTNQNYFQQPTFGRYARIHNPSRNGRLFAFATPKN